MKRYCPAENNETPFNQDPPPQEFGLKDLPRYLDCIPAGLSELTDEGVVPISGEAYSWRTDVPRVFLARSSDGKSAALLEINGEDLEEGKIANYLARHAAHITGADVRALGRIGAVVFDLMMRQYYPDEALYSANMLAWDQSMDKDRIFKIQPKRRNMPVRDGIRRQEYTATIPSHSEIYRIAEQHLGDWEVWERVAHDFPRTVVAGAVPAGIACYRPKDGLTFANGGVWSRAAGARLAFSRHDIVCVSTPQGHAVLMCLDTQYGVANCEPGEEHLQPALQWLAQELPEELIATYVSHPYGLLYGQIATRLINDNLGARGRRMWKGVAGMTGNYPLIDREDGSYYPMVLDAIFVPAEACIHDILAGEAFGAVPTPQQ